MDRGTWWATVHGVARVRHDLATKPLPLPSRRAPKGQGGKWGQRHLGYALPGLSVNESIISKAGLQARTFHGWEGACLHTKVNSTQNWVCVQFTLNFASHPTPSRAQRSWLDQEIQSHVPGYRHKDYWPLVSKPLLLMNTFKGRYPQAHGQPGSLGSICSWSTHLTHSTKFPPTPAEITFNIVQEEDLTRKRVSLPCDFSLSVPDWTGRAPPQVCSSWWP